MIRTRVQRSIVATRALTLVTGLLASAGLAQAQSDFRVLPYLMSPTTEGMTINWISFENVPGEITITGPGLTQPLVLGTTPVFQDVLTYVYNTENSPIVNQADGRVYFNNAPAVNYKHSATIGGLLAGSTYTYSAEQGTSTFNGTFTTAPLPTTTEALRFAVLSDSETLVIGRTTNREWNLGAQAAGSTGRPSGTGPGRTTYILTETVGYQENIKAIKSRQPDLIVMPGDLIQGSTAEQQRRWDEFWRHNAGEFDTLLTAVPLVAAIGNNCIFLNGANTAGLATQNQHIQWARKQWSAYFDFPAIPNANYRDLYHRTDYGPVTIITLCVVKAIDERNHLVAPAQGQATIDQDTNRDTNRAWFSSLYTFGDYPDFNALVGPGPGSPGEQWAWAVEQLEDARAKGQIVFVQWHHTPFSRGVHGSSITSNQSGEATRIYAPLMEQYRVAGVFCGHSEVAERSRFDLDNDGYSVNLWDVGAAGDGLRGVEDAPGNVNPAITAWKNANPGIPFEMNPYSKWTADQSEGELWQGNTLIKGGKHYGFLEVDVERLEGENFRVSFTPFHIFPLLDGTPSFGVTGFELRTFNDKVVLEGPANNLQPVTVPPCFADCDANGIIQIDDFVCFQTNYALGSTDADCDGSGDLGIDDFICFQTLFALGC
jgi:3',5'-cyclic AMP phosphodiesterase CpdA